jgi:hypothetical protein
LSKGKTKGNELNESLSSRNLLPPGFFEREAESQEKGKRSSGDPGIFVFVGADIKHRRRRANCFPSSTRLITMAPKETTPLVKQSAADEENFAKLKAYQP